MNTVFGLHVADIFVLALYLLGMAAIGFWSAKGRGHIRTKPWEWPQRAFRSDYQEYGISGFGFPVRRFIG